MMADSDWAAHAAKKIWEDLSDRQGFGLEVLEYDHPELFTIIQAVHAQLIRDAALKHV